MHIKFQNRVCYRSSDTMYIPRGTTNDQCMRTSTWTKIQVNISVHACTLHKTCTGWCQWIYVSVCRFCWYQCSHCQNLVHFHLQKLPFFNPPCTVKIKMPGVPFPGLLSLRVKCSICKSSISTFQKKAFRKLYQVSPHSSCLSNMQKMQRCSDCIAPI